MPEDESSTPNVLRFVLEKQITPAGMTYERALHTAIDALEIPEPKLIDWFGGIDRKRTKPASTPRLRDTP